MTDLPDSPGSPAPYSASPSSYGSAPGPSGGQPFQVKERPFVVGLLLTIVTLGIYHFIWHYQTHDELARQMGRENTDKGLFWGYLAVSIIPLVILLFLFTQFVALIIASGGDDPSDGQIFGFLMSFLVWIILMVVLGIIGLVLYALYVLRQWELLKIAKARMGLQLRASAGAFMGLWFGGMAINTFTGIPANLVMGPIAYYYLQENYNDIPRAMQHGQVDPTAYQPGGQGWHAGPVHPPSTGPAPIAPGQTYAAAPPAYSPAPQQYAPPTNYGAPGGSWEAQDHYGAPARPPAESEARGEGFSVRERAPAEQEAPAPYTPQAPLMEQSFQCPRCHSHVSARGQPGESVTIHCPQCRETGTVRLPER